MGQKYAQGDTTGIKAYYDDAINSAAQIGTAIQITDVEWLDSVANPGKYIIDATGAFVVAPPPTQAQLDAVAWAAYQAQAKVALADTDTTMHRIVEGVSLGLTSWTAADVVAWVQYRQALRAILSQAQPATIPTSLPTKPPYPAGT